MRALVDTLERGGVGVFESPTGTGKSMSIICGVLHWLRFQHESKRKPPIDLEAHFSSVSSDPDWISAFVHKREREEEEEERNESRQSKRVRQRPHKILATSDPFMLEEEDKDHTDDKDDEDDEEDDEKNNVVGELVTPKARVWDDPTPHPRWQEFVRVVQFFYCSRTHSQLSQFLGEIRRTAFAPWVRCITLGSRRSLCIHDRVRNVKGLGRMTDACLDLRRGKGGPSASCPFYDEDRLQHFQDEVLEETLDVEDLATLGRRRGCCPYYGARGAVRRAHVVALPYTSLFHRDTRDALGLELDGSVVVVDEAHNIIEAINSVHSVVLTGPEISRAHSQLSLYQQRYETRLKPQNTLLLNQLATVLRALMRSMSKTTSDAPIVSTINDFLFDTHLDNVNFFELEKFVRSTNLVNKVKGFVEATTAEGTGEEGEAEGEGGEDASSFSPLQKVISFVLALMHSDEDGRVLITSNASLKFLMLNPGVHFKGMLKSARAIVLAGGTMQPMADFTQQLFSDFPSDRVTLFSCGHIIPPQNLRALSVMRGPTNVEFEYSYGTRSSTSVIDELGRTMANLSMVIPDGIIVFFPSYMYEDEVYHHWESSGVLTRITLRKKIFRETRTTSRGEEVLRAYQQCIESGRGAVLLSVVGGKMSEGINFSDKLGRCVVMVGLPFSNPQDPELVERMKYLGQKAGEVVNATEPLRSQVCREFYENQCMKAVNQTIGRCIRHIGDYAVILLCDRRYARTSIRQKLPKWISSQLQETTSFGDVMSSVARFFQDRRKEDR